MEALNTYIDQTILKPDATENDILIFLKDVEKHSFYAACVHPCWVALARQRLPAHIKVCSVVGFPLGASSTKAKVCAAEDLVQNGCDEVDMVMNIGRLKSADYKYVGREIRDLTKALQGRVLKVIIETCLLTNDEKRAAAHIIVEKGAHFVKTSTGFSKQGACIVDVKMLRKVVGPRFGVKASGGIRDYATTIKFIEAGADRIGTSSGIKIMQECERLHPKKRQ